VSDVTLRFSADDTELRADIDSDIKALGKMASTIDATSAAAVAATRSEIAAQREQLVILNAKASQVSALDVIERRFEKSVTAAAGATQREAMSMAQAQEAAIRMDAQMTKAALNSEAMPRAARRGANAMSMLAYSATGMGGSVQGATIALGSMSSAILASSRSAALAASATGIGALITLLGVLYETAKSATQALHDLPTGALNEAQSEHIKNLKSVTAATQELTLARQQANGLANAVGDRGDTEGLQALVNAQEKVHALMVRVNELRDEEKKKAEETAKVVAEQEAAATQRYLDMRQKLGDEVLKSNESDLDAYAKKRLAATQSFNDEVESIHKLKNLDADRQNQLIALADKRRKLTVDQLNAEQAAANVKFSLETNAGSDDVVTSFQARMALIELEKKANIDAGVSKTEAERKANAEILALRTEVTKNALSDMQVLADAAIGSKSREAQAVGTVVKTMRRLEMGYEGAKNTVESIEAAGKALMALASGDAAGAALYGASALKHAAAAAMAFKEAGGGGGGGGGAGGGGGGGGGGSNQRESTALGASLGSGQSDQPIKIEFVYIQKDSTGKETSRMRQDIERLNDRNQPIRMGA